MTKSKSPGSTIQHQSRDWALDLWDMGFQVIHVPLGRKFPSIAWKTYQDKRVPRQQVEEWFAEGEHNLAIITGAISGVVVVDGDSEDACTYIEETCAPTPMVISTGKGRHYYYRHPGGKIPNAARILDLPPVDIRGDGGLVIGPGSLHPKGTHYHVAEGHDLANPADLPIFDASWFPESIKAEPTSFIRPILCFGGANEKDAYEQASRYARGVPGAIQGAGGDNQTYILACRLVRGFDLTDAQALDILRDWNTRCTPAWDESELMAKINHARRYGTGDFGSMLARNRAQTGLLIYGRV